jgi:hypothetical protein
MGGLYVVGLRAVKRAPTTQVGLAALMAFTPRR